MIPKEMTYYQFLRTVELFKDFEPQQLKKLANIAQQRNFATNELIYRAGDVGQGLYVIQTGAVTIEMDLADYGVATLYEIGPQQLFGWSSLIAGRRKKAQARATEPTEVLFLNAFQIHDLTRLDHKLENAMMNCIIYVMADRLYHTREQLAHRTVAVR